MHEPSFDPYHKWLGIPPKDQPPDHYRLLGIERFEADPDVIAHAADARMTHIKTLATGAYVEWSQEILNAISAARICLLNPEAKIQYDAALWEWLEQQRLATSPVPPPLPGELQATSAGKRGLPVSMSTLIVLGLSVCVVLLAVAIVLLKRGREPAIATTVKPPTATVEEPIVSGVPSVEEPKASKPFDEPSKPKPEAVQSKPSTSEPVKAAEKPVVASREASKPDAKPESRPEPKAESEPKPASKPEAKPELKAEPKPATVTETPNASKRAAVPSVEEQNKLQKQVDDVYRPAEANTPQKKQELAEKMFRTGEETNDDPVSRYVLMRSAWQLAGEATNLDLALDMVDRASESYDLDVREAKIDILERAEKSSTAGSETEALSRQIVQKSLALVETLLRDDDYQTALTLLDKTAIPAARRTNDKQLPAELAKRRTQARRQREEYAAVEKARETLSTNATDGEANLMLGRWHCLAKGQWEKGLPYLAKASDKELADLAQRELQGVSSSQAQVELADAWWELSDRAGPKKDNAAAALRARAGHWYQRVLPFLTGILKEKAEKRLASAETAESRGDYALGFDGWKSHAIVDFGYAGTCPITIEAIAKPTILPAASIGTVIGNYDRTDPSGLMLTCQSSIWGFSFVEMQPPRTGNRSTTPPPGSMVRLSARTVGRVKEDEWTHVAGVFDGKQLRFYVDGQLQDTRAVSGVHKPTTKLPFVLGACPSTGPSGLLLDEYFKGFIKAVRISSVARYTDNFQPPTQLLREDANTQLLLVFNKGSGDAVPDTSGRKNSPTGSGGHKRSATSSAKLNGTKWVQLGAATSETKDSTDRGATR